MRGGAASDEAEGLKIVGEIQHVRLEPGDVIIVTVPGRITLEQAGRIKQAVTALWAEHRVLVLDDGVRMEVARKVKDAA